MNNKEIFIAHVFGMVINYLCEVARKRSLNTLPIRLKKCRVDFKPLAGSGGRSIKGMVLILTALIVYEGENISASLGPLISNRIEVSLNELF